MTEPPNPPKPDEASRTNLLQEVRDAVQLLEFAIAQGRLIADTLIQRIKKAQNFLSLDEKSWPSDADRSDFESAYRDLAQFLKPVTADTLRATTDRRSTEDGVRFFHASPAKWFSRRLYLFVLLCATLIICDRLFPLDEEHTSFATFSKPLLPFMYGWLGALAYLLRSAHTYIIDRSFDMNRLPEYYNRMLLGFLSGGVVLLFVNPESVGVGQSAISFIVGYNTDYLFQTIERLGQAVFPKVSLTPVPKDGKKDGPSGVTKLTIDKRLLSPGESGNVSVVLAGPAPSGGVSVALTADPGITLPSTTVKVAEGTTTGAFTFKVEATATTGTKLTITAKVDGSSANDTLTVA